jgi:WD40 repeat protein
MEIWSLPTFVKVNQVSEGGTVAVAFSPDSSLLASVPRDSSIAIRDAITCDVRKILKGHSSLVLSIQFSPDGKWLVSGSWDFTVRVWDVGSGKLQSTLIGHEKAVSCVKFLAEGNLVASGSHDETVRIWNWKTGEEVARFDKYFLARDKIRISHGFAISPDSSLLAFSSYDIDTTAGWEKKVPRVHIWRLFLN